jgi:hypothetical protein
MNDTRRKIVNSITFLGENESQVWKPLYRPCLLSEIGSVKLVPVTSTEPLYTFASKTLHSNGAFVNDKAFKLLKCFVTTITTTTTLVFYPT